MLSLEKPLYKSPSLRLSRPFALVLELAHVLFPDESFYLFVLELLEFLGTMERAKATIFKSFCFSHFFSERPSGRRLISSRSVHIFGGATANSQCAQSPNSNELAPLGSKRTSPTEVHIFRLVYDYLLQGNKYTG